MKDILSLLKISEVTYHLVDNSDHIIFIIRKLSDNIYYSYDSDNIRMEYSDNNIEDLVECLIALYKEKI